LPLQTKIDDETLAQLRAFSSKNGRKWKETLTMDYWMRGEPVPGFNKLYGLRNTHGSSWLCSFRFPKS
jgi:hypothetical protein